MVMIRATVLMRTRRKRKSKQNAEGSIQYDHDANSCKREKVLDLRGRRRKVFTLLSRLIYRNILLYTNIIQYFLFFPRIVV